MSSRSDKAVSLFNAGLNCSQAVFSAFCEDYGLSRATALRIGCGFGGGVRSGEICGAVSGAVMVIGLKYGNDRIEDLEAKMNCSEKTIAFLNRFRTSNGSITCREILGCDISTDEGRRMATERDLFSTTCVDMVRNSVELLEDMGY